MVACGSHGGDITLLELSDSLSLIQPNEKPNITAVSKQNIFQDCFHLWIRFNDNIIYKVYIYTIIFKNTNLM